MKRTIIIMGFYYGSHKTIQNGLAWAEGDITTIYDWKPDNLPGTSTPDPNDVPPPYVIAAEYSEVWINGSGGSVLFNGDSDLGFEPIIVGTGTGADPLMFYSGGVRYKKIAGTSEIVLTCSPYAEVFTTGGFMYLSVTYYSKIVVPRIKWEGTTNFADGRKVITGQQLKASLELHNNSLAGSTIEIMDGSTTWTEPSAGGAFKNYITTLNESLNQSVGSKLSMGKSDYRLDQLYFYTATSGTFTTLGSFKLKIPQGTRYEDLPPSNPPAGYDPLKMSVLSLPVQSVKPTASGWTVATGTTGIWNNRLQFGGPGQEWTDVSFSVAPFPLAGQACFVQLITPNRRLKRELLQNAPPNTPTEFKKAWKNSEKGLDAGIPYPFWGAWSIAGNMVTGEDSPASPLLSTFTGNGNPNNPHDPWQGDNWEAGLLESGANDLFETTLMYRPPPVERFDNNGAFFETVWIPIQRYTWKWNARAIRSDIEMPYEIEIDLSNGVVDAPGNTDLFPQWSFYHKSPFGHKPISWN